MKKIVHEIDEAFQLPFLRTRKTKHNVQQSKQHTTTRAVIIKKTPAAMARVCLKNHLTKRPAK
jgi:hypothetical protein